MRNTQTYSDIDFNFIPNPNTKDLAVKIDEEAIKMSIYNLVMTAHYERPFHSTIGSTIKHLLFEPITPAIGGIIKQEISNLISAHEPRATLVDVITTYFPDNNTISITIVFKMNGTSLVTQTTITVERTR